uniref:Vacuolar protein sorting-associated protein 52 homolog n=1 Tax=Strongyloides venezuelensis TaxID=75913 RepID=A0A0K0FFQ2_STRVS
MASIGQVVAFGNIMDDLLCVEDMFLVCLSSQKVETISNNFSLNLIKTLLRFLSDQVRTLMAQLERPCKDRIQISIYYTDFMKYFYLPVKGILKFNVEETNTNIKSDIAKQFVKTVKEVYRHHNELTGLELVSVCLFMDANKIVRFIRKFYKHDIYFSRLSKYSNIFRFLLQETLDDINCPDFDIPDLAHTDDINSFICYSIFLWRQPLLD